MSFAPSDYFLQVVHPVADRLVELLAAAEQRHGQQQQQPAKQKKGPQRTGAEADGNTADPGPDDPVMSAGGGEGGGGGAHRPLAPSMLLNTLRVRQVKPCTATT